jgi:hypothetical protein
MSVRAAAVVAAVLALAACSSAGTGPAATSPTTSGTPAPTATAPAGTSSAAAAPARLTGAQARTVLLTVEDLPTGYAADEPTTPENRSAGVTPARCGPLADQTVGTPLARAAFSEGGPTGASLVQDVVAPPKGRSAVARVEQLGRLVDACPRYTVREGGRTGTVRLSAVSFPEVGDAVLATRVTVDVDGVTAAGDVVYVAAGSVTMRFATSGVTGAMSTKDLAAAVRASVARVEALG